MTEAQYNTLIIGFAVTIGSTIAAAMIALLINNARLGDVKDALRSEIGSKTSATRESILAQMATYQLDIISKIAELDNRITRLER
jgi:hypothetical protein